MAVLEYSIPLMPLSGVAYYALQNGIKQWAGKDKKYYAACVARGEITDFKQFQAPDSYSVLLFGSNAQLKPQYEKCHARKEEILKNFGKGLIWGALNRIRRNLSRDVVDYVKTKGITFTFKEDVLNE